MVAALNVFVHIVCWSLLSTQVVIFNPLPVTIHPEVSDIKPSGSIHLLPFGNVQPGVGTLLHPAGNAEFPVTIYYQPAGGVPMSVSVTFFWIDRRAGRRMPWGTLVQRELGGVPPWGGGLREGRLLLGLLGAGGAYYKARRPPPAGRQST